MDQILTLLPATWKRLIIWYESNKQLRFSAELQLWIINVSLNQFVYAVKLCSCQLVFDQKTNSPWPIFLVWNCFDFTNPALCEICRIFCIIKIVCLSIYNFDSRKKDTIMYIKHCYQKLNLPNKQCRIPKCFKIV